MLTRKFLVALVLVAFPSLATHGQDGDFFFSFDGNGANVGNPTGTFQTGDSGSLFYYYSGTSDIDTGFTTGLETSNSGVIEFTGSEVFNSPVVGFPIPR